MATAWQGAAGPACAVEVSNAVARLRAQLSTGPFHLAPLSGVEKEAPRRAGTGLKPAARGPVCDRRNHPMSNGESAPAPEARPPAAAPPRNAGYRDRLFRVIILVAVLGSVAVIWWSFFGVLLPAAASSRGNSVRRWRACPPRWTTWNANGPRRRRSK